MADKVRVRVIRPHDTAEGMRAPGDEYDRTATDADKLTAQGVVELATTKPKAKAKGK